jgi:hypothetical protein
MFGGISTMDGQGLRSGCEGTEDVAFGVSGVSHASPDHLLACSQGGGYNASGFWRRQL